MAKYKELAALITSQNYPAGTTNQAVYDDLTAKSLPGPIPALEYLKKAIDLGIWDAIMASTDATLPKQSLQLFASKIEIFGFVNVDDQVYKNKMDFLVNKSIITANQRKALDDLSLNRLAKIDTIDFGKELTLEDIKRVRG